MKPDDIAQAENYELGPVSLDTDSEPLLPRYERHEQSPIPVSLHPQVTRVGRKNRFRRIVTCLCVGIMVLLPMAALAGCWFGRMTLDRVRDWDQLPAEWREWLDQVKPKGGHEHADHENFPTE